MPISPESFWSFTVAPAGILALVVTLAYEPVHTPFDENVMFLE